MPSHHLILCRPLLLVPSIFPSIRVFFNESVLCIRWPKCWSFSFTLSPSNEYSGLISFRMNWLDLLAVQETLKSLFQHHSSKAFILRHPRVGSQVGGASLPRGEQRLGLGCCCSVAKSCPTLQPHGLQPIRLLCPLPSPGVFSNANPLSR